MILQSFELSDGTFQDAPLGGRFVYNAARLLGYDVSLEYYPYYDDVDYTDTDVLGVDVDDFRKFPRDIWNTACDVLEACVHGQGIVAVAAPLRVLAAAVRNAED